MAFRTRSQWAARNLPLLAVLLGLLSPGCLDAAWTVKKFQIYFGRPARTPSLAAKGAARLADKLGRPMDEAIPPPVPIAPALIQEIENYLADVAEAYDRMGFDPPDLEPVVDRGDGVRAYRIFLFPFEASGHLSPMYYLYDCDGGIRRTIRVNSTFYIRDGKLLTTGYQSLAHELFHAVQMGQPLYKERANCHLGDWITEGTADAMGADMARELRKIDFPNKGGAWPMQRWGLRSYKNPLWVADDDEKRSQEGYGASSFWRYLGEFEALGGSPGVALTLPKYSFLATLFRRPLEGPPSQRVEMKWIHDALVAMDPFKRGLDRIYPEFANVFAAFPNHRIHLEDKAPAEAEAWWLSKMFEQCPVLPPLSPTRPKVTVKAEVSAVGSWCALLDLEFPGSVDLAVHASGPVGHLMKGLTLGADGGHIVARPVIVTPERMAIKEQAFWLLPLEGSRRHLLILSNVAARPERSLQLHVTLDLSVSDLFNNLLPASLFSTSSGPAPPKPESNAKGAAPAKPTAAPRTAAAKPAAETVSLMAQADRRGGQLRSGINSLTSHLAMAGSVNRTPREPPCKDAFRFDPCGPAISISSSIIPSVSPNLEASGGRGGLFGQFATMLAGYGSAGLAGTSMALWADGKMAYDLDGSTVTIILPLIDYGFTGTFHNAALQVHRAGGGMYEAIGPGDALPGPGTLYPLSGKVTIEEYSPAVLRGTFQGALVDTLKLEITSDDMTLPVHREVRGRFAVVAPWRSDDRVRSEHTEQSEESVLQDIIAMYPGRQQQIRDALQKAKASRPGTTAGTSGRTGAAVRPVCDCSCNAAATASTACAQFCASTFVACRGERAGPVSSNTPPAAPTEVPASAAGAADLRGRFQTLLEQVYPGPRMQTVRDTMLKNFDGQRTMGGKQLYYDLLLEKRRR